MSEGYRALAHRGQGPVSRTVTTQWAVRCVTRDGRVEVVERSDVHLAWMMADYWNAHPEAHMTCEVVSREVVTEVGEWTTAEPVDMGE